MEKVYIDDELDDLRSQYQETLKAFLDTDDCDQEEKLRRDLDDIIIRAGELTGLFGDELFEELMKCTE